jgi:YcxB-like protein
VKITYRLSFYDYFDAAQARDAKGWKARGLILLAVAAALFGVWIGTRKTQNGYVYVLLSLLLLGSLALANWLKRRSFKKAYVRGAVSTAPKDFTAEISEDGIQLDGSASREEWSHFSKYSESINAFILYQADSIYAIFPKRSFDTNAMNTFRRLVQAKLARC